MNGSWEAPTLGVLLGHGGRARIRVWAPSHRNVALRILTPAERVIPLQSEPHGYHTAEVDGIEAGATYRVQLRKNLERADPASRSQPSGVNGPSSIVDPNSFPWTDSHWSGLHLDEFVFYELHIGCFTPEGTFRSAIPELARLREIGFTAVEVMPVAEFPGGRNWGYDGVFPFSVQHTYGGPDAFKRFIDASHRAGLAVVLDVVYNHVGPEGNHFSDFGPYFSDRYRIPWGQAINFDGPGSDEVRRYFIENALRWFTEFHIDALRLDAVHAIFDGSANPFLAELGDIVHTEAKRMGSRSYFLIAESDLNDPRLLRDREEGGFGLDAQWADDFHHALHALVTQEGAGYYSDFGDWRQLSTAFERPFVYAGEHSPYRERRHGHPPTGLPRERFVVCAQNHDQVGNRARGDRLSSIVSFERWKAAVGATFLSPYLPLAFMGDEYAEHRPFPFFTDYSDPDLQQGVLRGRQQEFAEFGWPPEAIPDPQSPRTYEEAHLNRAVAGEGIHSFAAQFVRAVLHLRQNEPALHAGGESRARLSPDANLVIVERWRPSARALLLIQIDGPRRTSIRDLPPGAWQMLLSSADPLWGGPGPGASDVLEEGGVEPLPLPGDAVMVLVPDRRGG